MAASATFNRLSSSLRLPVSKATASILTIAATVTVLAALKSCVSQKRRKEQRENERFELVEGLEKDVEFDVVVVGGGASSLSVSSR